MTTETQTATTNFDNNTFVGTKIPYDAINEPGCYVCCWSGHLLRVPADGVATGRSPLINVVGPEPLYVWKISDNPYIPMTKARMLCSNHDIDVNF